MAMNHVGTVAGLRGHARGIVRYGQAIGTERMAQPVLHPFDAGAQGGALEAVAQSIVVGRRTDVAFLPEMWREPLRAVVRDWHNAATRRFGFIC